MPFRRALPDDSTEEQIPVLLRHSRLLRPFEMLVSTYGLPNYRELEPTLFVALSYIVMFGMMFGDAGHGAGPRRVWPDCSACRPLREGAGLLVYSFFSGARPASFSAWCMVATSVSKYLRSTPSGMILWRVTLCVSCMALSGLAL